jgi:hypothetical protein
MNGFVYEAYPVIDKPFKYKPVDEKRDKKYTYVRDDQRKNMKVTMGQPGSKQV